MSAPNSVRAVDGILQHTGHFPLRVPGLLHNSMAPEGSHPDEIPWHACTESHPSPRQYPPQYCWCGDNTTPGPVALETS